MTVDISFQLHPKHSFLLRVSKPRMCLRFIGSYVSRLFLWRFFFVGIPVGPNLVNQNKVGKLSTYPSCFNFSQGLAISVHSLAAILFQKILGRYFRHPYWKSGFHWLYSILNIWPNRYHFSVSSTWLPVFVHLILPTMKRTLGWKRLRHCRGKLMYESFSVLNILSTCAERCNIELNVDINKRQ